MILPPIPVVGKLARYREWIIEGHENYQKRSFRNRLYLNSVQGRSLFSIPLEKGKNEQMPIREVRIAGESWQKAFSQRIQTNYGSAPFYEHYAPLLMSIIYQGFQFLFDLNLANMQFLIDQLGLDVHCKISEGYSKEPSSGIEDIRDFYRPNMEFFSKKPVFTYEQVFHDVTGFVPHLSILDLLMCCGPEALTLLKRHCT